MIIEKQKIGGGDGIFVQFGTFSFGPKALDVCIKNWMPHYAIWVNSN